MALTQIIRQECPTCKKIAVEVSRMRLGQTILIKLACGHLINSEAMTLSEQSYESIVFSDGCKPRPYQIDCVKFAENADCRVIIADEQGLGKTIESLSLLRLHPEKLLPAVIIVPTTVKLQWMREIHRICSQETEGHKDTKFLTQIIQSGKEKAVPGFQIYITTYDLLKKDDLFSLLPEGTVKTVIIDECQRIKNHLSDRAKAVQKIAKSTPHIIAMSGTPIKNNAGEYFTVLNLVKPTMFPHYQKYIDNYCDAYSNGWGQKVGGLKDIERFHEDTKDIIIRRTKSEVLKDLPSLERKFYHVELDKKLNRAYAEGLKELDDIFYDDSISEFEKSTNIIAIYSKLRHITGLSKVEQCIEFATEFLISSDRKLTIFTHHKDVADILVNTLNEWCKAGGFEEVCHLHSGLNGDQRAALVEKFKNTNSRILIASTLAAGEGLNLQFCSDAVLLERQWNPANEEQAEARFHRFGQENNVSVTYMIASGTIDEFFTELVEIKRNIVAGTLDGKEIEWNQQGLMAELAQMLLTKGRDRWRL